MLSYAWVQFPTIAVLALVFMVTPATASAASSTAYGINAQFTVTNLSTGTGPFPLVEGATIPGRDSYEKTATIATVNEILNVAPGPIPVPALFLDAANVVSHVKGAFGVDTFSSEGDATLHTVNLSLNLNPLPPVIPFPQPFLAVSASDVDSHASFSDQVLFPPVPAGSAAFAHVTVSGSLIGNQVLSFSGPAPKNKILYQSPTADSDDVPKIVITLNKQVETVVVTCNGVAAGCVATPVGIVTEALSISLQNADLHGHLVSGEIVVGYSSAQ